MFRLTLIYLTFFGYVILGIYCRTMIFPGTKWCGIGNVANSTNDLGFAKDIDQCCRTHDLCPDYVEPNQIKYGLSNNGFITKSLCSCDKKLYDCLKNVNSFLSMLIGDIYFNMLQCQCFDNECEVNKSQYWDDCDIFKNTGNKTWYKNKEF